MPNNQPQRIVVTIDDQHLPEIQAIASSLRTAGMRVDNVLSVTGIITGEVSQIRINELRDVSGVADVEPDQEMQAI
ncbi:MAG: hypothetical protein PX483_00200 [Nostocales cyanobacterium LE14-WE4]|jgi:hypothetical protein|nr:hypothetical protein [Anabaena sp. 49633_E8]MCE2700132.1 hypothetical protein [Anabaena sp. 49633_E8]MDJ0499288.1 hypothetical protein [Nostocales cyanobacterium LE14-WE4]